MYFQHKPFDESQYVSNLFPVKYNVIWVSYEQLYTVLYTYNVCYYIKSVVNTS